jgi:hypothetical protein
MTEYKLQHCENCDHIIYFEPEDDDLIYICPICGNINDVTNLVMMDGTFELQSPQVFIETDEPETSELSLELGDDEIDNAIKILLKNGWRLKFFKNKK